MRTIGFFDNKPKQTEPALLVDSRIILVYTWQCSGQEEPCFANDRRTRKPASKAVWWTRLFDFIEVVSCLQKCSRQIACVFSCKNEEIFFFF